MAIKEKLAVRSAIKKRKPTYKRVQSHQFAKLSETKWRKPKGMGNKVRRGRRGKPSMPEVGFGSPSEVKGLNRDGLREVIVGNSNDLAKIDSKTEIAVIGSTVGARKKIEILKKAKEMKLNVSNVKDVDAAVKALTKAPKKKETKKSEKKIEAKADKKEAKAEEKKDAKTDGGKKE